MSTTDDRGINVSPPTDCSLCHKQLTSVLRPWSDGHRYTMSMSIGVNGATYIPMCISCWERWRG